MKKIVTVAVVLFFAVVALIVLPAGRARLTAQTTGPVIGEVPAIQEHIDQRGVNEGRVLFQELFDAGERLFIARFTITEGQGRPAATGDGKPVKRAPGADRSKFSRTPAFLQSSGPTASACAGCHYQPGIGGAGDFAVNVHVTANNLDPPTESFATEFGDERNSLGLFGAGAIELVAREMSADLIRIRDGAVAQARANGGNFNAVLSSKGVDFGEITVSAAGVVDSSRVKGVDPDLVIKPFHQKGVVVSLREFSNNAFNHHHGMQSTERFGRVETGSDDFDEDGVRDEITEGDVTAITVWQASLGVPGRVIPSDLQRRQAVDQGEVVFSRIGCASCHKPFLVLNNPVFSEPGPFNPKGNLRPQDVAKPFTFDLTREGMRPRLRRERDGTVLVRAFTDLKRHVIGDAQFPWFLNERVVQGGVPTDQFLTRKLWDVGNTAPYGHRGDLTTITEAILNHGGEGRQARDAFAALAAAERNAVVEFLKSLQILPEGVTQLNTTPEELKRLRDRLRAPVE